MKRSLSLLLVIMLVLSLTACSTANEQAESSDMSQEKQIAQSENEDTSVQNSNEPAAKESAAVTEKVNKNYMKLKIGDHIFTATLTDNSSTEALMEKLKAGPITINMQDYGSMEKVGPLGTSLPRNDKQITTEPGDLILYQGNSFVIYYAPNSWNFTRLGKINDVTQKELKEALGNGDVKVTLLLD